MRDAKVCPMVFTLSKLCADGTAILEGGDGQPIAAPRKVLSGGKPAGTIYETIGRVSKPLYVARLEKGFAIGAEFE